MPKPSSGNNSAKKKRKKAAPRGGGSAGPVKRCGYPNASGKPCRQTILTANGLCSRHADQPPPTVGAPLGNQNARKHGLFAKSLDEKGLEVYAAAKGLSPEAIARDTAEFLVAQVAQAFLVDEQMELGTGVVADALRAAVEAEDLDPKTAARLMQRLSSPDIVALGKALGPLKGLLDWKAAADDKPDAGGQGGDPDTFARRVLEELGAGDAG